VRHVMHFICFMQRLYRLADVLSLL